jgi:hypothetical protein
MSYVIRIFCESLEPILRSDIIQFIEEGSYFDACRFEPVKDDDNTWTRLAVHFAEGKRPILFHKNVMDSLVSSEIAELVESLDGREGCAIDTILAVLRKTKQVIGIEVDRDNVTETAWEMLDSIEGHIARRCGGMVYAPDDGYFDARLQPILRL